MGLYRDVFANKNLQTCCKYCGHYMQGWKDRNLGRLRDSGLNSTGPIRWCKTTTASRRSRPRSLTENGQRWKLGRHCRGRFSEPPPGAIEIDRRIHSCSSLATRYWLKRETCKAFTERLSRGKHASRSLRSEFIPGVGGGAARTGHVARIHHKQVARAVTG